MKSLVAVCLVYTWCVRPKGTAPSNIVEGCRTQCVYAAEPQAHSTLSFANLHQLAWYLLKTGDPYIVKDEQAAAFGIDSETTARSAEVPKGPDGADRAVFAVEDPGTHPGEMRPKFVLIERRLAVADRLDDRYYRFSPGGRLLYATVEKARLAPDGSVIEGTDRFNALKAKDPKVAAAAAYERKFVLSRNFPVKNFEETSDEDEEDSGPQPGH